MDIDRIYLKIIEKTGLSIIEVQNLIKLKKEEVIIQKEKKFKTYKILKHTVSDQEALINVAEDLGVKIQITQEEIQIRLDASDDHEEEYDEEYDATCDDEETLYWGHNIKEHEEEYDEETIYWENIEKKTFWEEKQRIEDVKAMEEMDEEYVYENLIEQQVAEEDYYSEFYHEITKEKDENRKLKRS